MCSPADFHSVTYPRARKPYRCYVCDMIIPKGQQHLAWTVKSDDIVSTARLHPCCYEWFHEAAHAMGMDCLAFEEVWDWLIYEEYVEDIGRLLPPWGDA